MFHLFHATAHDIYCLNIEGAPEHAFPCQGLSPSVQPYFTGVYIYTRTHAHAHTHTQNLS